jgi:hypothetical protein
MEIGRWLRVENNYHNIDDEDEEEGDNYKEDVELIKPSTRNTS